MPSIAVPEGYARLKLVHLFLTDLYNIATHMLLPQQHLRYGLTCGSSRRSDQHARPPESNILKVGFRMIDYFAFVEFDSSIVYAEKAETAASPAAAKFNCVQREPEQCSSRNEVSDVRQISY